MLTYDISEIDHCRSLESFLTNLLPGAPRSYLAKLVKSGHVTVNGIPASLTSRLFIDNLVALKESARTLELRKNPPAPLDRLYSDNRITAFNKPAGMPMHRAAEVTDHNLVDLANDLREACGESGSFRPVNRLDRGTSGVVLLARDSRSAGMFGRVVKEEGLGKVYLAMVAGRLPQEGVIDVPLEGKESSTRYRTLYQQGGTALAAVWPVTGRMHQIRLHFRAIGHPILGDTRYGGPELSDCPGFALHSFRTRLNHPETGAPLDICAPLPPEFIALVRRMAGEQTRQLLLSLADI